MSKTATKTKTTKSGLDKGGFDQAAFDVLTDEDIAAAAATDPDNPILTPEQLARMRRISPARFIRQKLRMTPQAFADAYDIPVGILQDWERHRSQPTPVELAYLRKIEKFPDLLRKATA
jgi:putative transcriptional regulator